MNIEESPPIEAVGEREIDYSIAQLLSTSPRFRRWFVGHAVPGSEFEESIGVITHAHYAGEVSPTSNSGF